MMTELDLKFLCGEAVKIAREAGEIVMEYYHNGAEEMIKSDGTDVTEADLASDAFITAALQKLTPNIPVATEEGVEAERFPDVSGGRYWIADPLDGTIPFIKRQDRFCVLISLIDNFEPVLGVAYYPAKKHLMHAIKNNGAFFVDENASTVKQLNTVPLLSDYPKIFCNPNYNDKDMFYGMFGHIPDEYLIFNEKNGIYEMIVGDVDIMAFTNAGGGEWDIAAFKVIIEESGGAFSKPLKFGNIKQKITPMCFMRHRDSMRFIKP